MPRVGEAGRMKARRKKRLGFKSEKLKNGDMHEKSLHRILIIFIK